jgi:hypothetical protein
MNALRVDLKKWVSDTDPQSLYDYPEHYIVCISSWFFLETGFSPGLKIPPFLKGGGCKQLCALCIMSIFYTKFWQAVNLLRRVETRLERFKASGAKHFLQALTPLFVSQIYSPR